MERIEEVWGWFEKVFSETSNYKCKRMYVNPHSSIPLQSHETRNEYWTVVQGDGLVSVGENDRNVTVGDFIFVPRTTVHKIEGGDAGVTVIQIQIGDPCEDKDIAIFEEYYGKIDNE